MDVPEFLRCNHGEIIHDSLNNLVLMYKERGSVDVWYKPKIQTYYYEKQIPHV